MKKSVTLGAFVLVGLGVALALAFFVSPEASSSPDGLEKVATDEGFVDTADDHALADLPTADYGVEGVDNERFSTGLAGIIGVLVTFAVGTGVLMLALRARGRRRAVAQSPR